LKRVLLILAWFLATVGLYAGLVALELDWNFPDWQPRWDVPSCAILFWLAGMLGAIWFLSRAGRERLTLTLSLLPCLALLILAVYLLPPEPLKPGLLGRDFHSPLWYRGGRAAVMFLPGAFWTAGRMRMRRGGNARRSEDPLR
jgi:peptidoglycan/LPS O-acetylase OafA/YrhL